MPTKIVLNNFLKEAGWDEAERQDFPADFSTRTYARLTDKKKNPSTAILMIAAPDQKTDLYIKIGSALRKMGFAAPEIYFEDADHGLLLIEDFGDDPTGKALDAGKDRAPYDRQAAKLLADLHKKFSPDLMKGFLLPVFDSKLFTEQTNLFLEYYFSAAMGRTPSREEIAAFFAAWAEVLDPLDKLPRSLLLRDFMPDNTMQLEGHVSGYEMGLIDFQDAGLGPIAYDLASWCEQVRRDGGHESLESVFEAYCAENNEIPKEELLKAGRILLAQRYTRILGILTRLERGSMIPRVEASLQDILQDESLTPVRNLYAYLELPFMNFSHG